MTQHLEDWTPNGWLDIEPVALVELSGIERKNHRILLHILSGLNLLKEGLIRVTNALQPIETAVSNLQAAVDGLTAEENEVRAAIQTLYSKVNNGQVVSRDDVDAVASAIDSITGRLSGATAELKNSLSEASSTGTPDDVPLPARSSDAPAPSTSSDAPQTSDSAVSSSDSPTQAAPAPVPVLPEPTVPASTPAVVDQPGAHEAP